MEFIKLNIQLFGAYAFGENDELTSKSGPNKGRVYAEFTEANPTADDILKNQTRITAYGEYSQGGSYSGYSTPRLKLTWYDDNENKSGKDLGTTNATSLAKGAKVKVEPKEFAVKHKEDGTLKGYVIAEWIWTGSGYCCNSGDATTPNTPLTSIPRAKTISALSADIGYDTSITLKQTSASYTATIEWECGELSGVIADKTKEISIGWKIPTDIYSQMLPTDKEKNITLKATTFNGDIKVGSTQTTTIKAKVNMEDNRPIAYLDVEDTNPKTLELTNDANKVVLNASNILCNVQGMTKNGATIKSMVINGIQLTDFTYRTPTEGTDEEITEIALDEFTIEKTTTNKFTLVVTDSRDNTNVVTTDNEITLDKIDYIVPTISNSTLFKRNAPTDGKVNLKYEGSFFNGSFQDAVPNNLEMVYAYKEKKDDEFGGWITLTPTIIQGQNSFKGEIQLAEEFDYDKVYTLKVSIKDALTELGDVYYIQDVSRGKPSHWYDDENFYVEGNYYKRNKETGKWQKFEGGSNKGGELPIGSIYINKTDSRNPSEILGYGKWSQIQGLNLIGAGTYTDSNGTSKTFNAGDVGGTYNHTHTQTNHIHARGTLTATIAIDASYIYSRWDTTANKNGTQTASWTRNARKPVGGTNSANTASMTEGAPVVGNTGAMLTTAGASATIYTGSTYHLTPSLVVYMWERTA